MPVEVSGKYSTGIELIPAIFSVPSGMNKVRLQRTVTMLLLGQGTRNYATLVDNLEVLNGREVARLELKIVQCTLRYGESRIELKFG